MQRKNCKIKRKGKGFVLNDALTLSRGEIIGVFDADTTIHKDYLTKVTAYVADPEIDGVQYDSGTIKVEAAKGVVCSRCWQVVDSIDENELCPRCAEVIKK